MSIQPRIDKKSQANIDLLEKFESGEITEEELSKNLSDNKTDTSSDNKILEKKEEDNSDIASIEASIEGTEVKASFPEIDQDNDSDDEYTDDKLTPSRKRRDRRKEAALADKMRIEQLEIENTEKAQQLALLQQQYLQHQQYIDNNIKLQQDGINQANIQRLQQLRQELAQATSVYDSVKVAQLTEEMVDLKSRILLAHNIPQQPQANSQINPNNATQLSSNVPTPQTIKAQHDQLKLQQQLVKFSSDPKHNWTNTSFGPNFTPLNSDAKVLQDIIIEMARNPQNDMRTSAFWEIIGEKISEALPHKYIDNYGKSKNPPVASGANKNDIGLSSKNFNSSIDNETINRVKSALANGLKLRDDSERRTFIRNVRQSIIAEREKRQRS